MGVEIKVDTSMIEDFAKKCISAGSGALKKEFQNWLESLGMDFLRIIQDEIIRKQVVDTRLLLSSFQKGEEGNVFILNGNDLSLEVGTNVEYAKFVNDGHNQDARFIPGIWVTKNIPEIGSKDCFVYTPDAKTGMMLTARFVPGKHYWESGVYVIEKMLPQLLERKLNQWLDNYF